LRKGLGFERLCGFTGTVFGPGFFVVRVGRHVVLAIVYSPYQWGGLVSTMLIIWQA